MRLALLGHPIGHSLSPALYKELLGHELQSYQLLDCLTAGDIPSLGELSTTLDGLSITAPYKKHFLNAVTITSPLVTSIGAINTISLRGDVFFATNTDLIATDIILRRFQKRFSQLQIVLLGNGSMAAMTKLLADQLSIPLTQLHRHNVQDLSNADLREFDKSGIQTLVINSCSRAFVFKGMLKKSYIFWDYNYKFSPHETTIPDQVLTYTDGQEMLRLQAEAALNFWRGK